MLEQINQLTATQFRTSKSPLISLKNNKKNHTTNIILPINKMYVQNRKGIKVNTKTAQKQLIIKPSKLNE